MFRYISPACSEDTTVLVKVICKSQMSLSWKNSTYYFFTTHVWGGACTDRLARRKPLEDFNRHVGSLSRQRMMLEGTRWPRPLLPLIWWLMFVLASDPLSNPLPATLPGNCVQCDHSLRPRTFWANFENFPLFVVCRC